MFDQIVLWLEAYPYLGVAAVFLLCGMGLPLPEELVLLAAGYVCAKLDLNLWVMMVWCGGAITAGDILPFLLGRVFGPRLLRLRWMRIFVTKRRLATFDLWFRRRGDWVILIARFIAGLRMVAFFTAGAMKMPWRRFLLYDGIGILLIVPLLTWLAYASQEYIDQLIEDVQQVERGILWTAIGGGVVLALWFWWWRRRRRRAARRDVGEAFVEPSRPIAGQSPPLAAPDEPAAADAIADDGPPDDRSPDDRSPDDRAAAESGANESPATDENPAPERNSTPRADDTGASEEVRGRDRAPAPPPSGTDADNAG